MKKQKKNTMEQIREKGVEQKYIDEAEKVLSNEQKFEQLLGRLEVKLKKIPKCGNALANAPIFASLLNNYFHKKYTRVPVGTIGAILVAVIYLITPVDIVPDWIVGLGYLDDAAIMAMCLELIKSDIEEYQEWRKVNS